VDEAAHAAADRVPEPMSNRRSDALPDHQRRGGHPLPSAQPASPHEDIAALRDAQRGQRLHRYMAAQGVASRRACEVLIQEGRVRVNGRVVTTLPVWIDPESDHIELDGKRVAPLRPTREGQAHCYVLLNKPRHVICTAKDPEGRRHVTELVELGRRLYPVGRLDAESTGLILLTDDGALAHRLTHPSYEISKVYHVTVRGRVSDEDIQRLKQGLFLTRRGTPGSRTSTRRASVAQLNLISRIRHRGRDPRTRLAVTLREGQNRQIRRLVARLGHKVLRLERVSLGPLRVRGLAVGQWRQLHGHETAALRRAVGIT